MLNITGGSWDVNSDGSSTLTFTITIRGAIYNDNKFTGVIPSQCMSADVCIDSCKTITLLDDNNDDNELVITR